MGFWEQLFDYFTRVDDILREQSRNYLEGNQKLINKLNELIEATTGIEPEPDIPRRHTPFYVEDRVTVGTDVVIDVRTDSEQGLGTVGRSGFIANDGVDNLHVIIDDGTGKSKEIRIDVGERLVIERDDNIWVDKVTLSSKIAFVDYRLFFVGR